VEKQSRLLAGEGPAGEKGRKLQQARLPERRAARAQRAKGRWFGCMAPQEEEKGAKI